jgi:hypothetical protein
MTNTTQAATTPAPKLTYVEKITKQYNDLATRINADTVKAQALLVEINSIAAIANLKAGDAVIVKTGRKFQDKDTTQIRDGVVLGVKTDDAGKNTFKVQVGSGFDADVVVVDSSAITLPVAAEAAQEAPAAE